MNTSRMVRSSDRRPGGPVVARAALADAQPSDPRTDIRFRLAIRLDGLERDNPAVLDLLADVHAGIHHELHGRASALRGTYTERNWRDVLLGARDLRVKDVCRLALSAHPWAKAAALAAIRVMARALGYDVVVVSAAPADPHDLVGEVSVATAAVVAELAADIKDGRLDASEVAALEPDVARLDQVRAALGATMASARQAVVTA